MKSVAGTLGPLVQKTRIVRFLRATDYNTLFSRNPYWATQMRRLDRWRPLMTESSYHMLHTVATLAALLRSRFTSEGSMLAARLRLASSRAARASISPTAG